MSASDCIFCKMIAGKISAQLIAESEPAIAINDISPQAPIHALVIPKKHIESLNNLSDDDRRSLLPAMYALADQVAQLKNVRDQGYRTVINNQTSAGQTVFHLHMHVLAGPKLKSGFGA